MLTKKFIALATLLSLLTVWIPIARAEDIDHDGEEDGFVELKTGETATEDGFFFNHSALSQLIAKQESKLSLLANEKDTQLKKLNLDLETLGKKKEIELNINKDMYESLLKIRQDRIDQLVSEQRWSDVKMIGGFVLGFAVTIAIFYAAVQVK
jgi:hypothetical protein